MNKNPEARMQAELDGREGRETEERWNAEAKNGARDESRKWKGVEAS